MGAGASVDFDEYEEDQLIQLLDRVRGKQIGGVDITDENISEIITLLQGKESTKEKNSLESDQLVCVATPTLHPSKRLQRATPLNIDNVGQIKEVVCVFTTEELSQDNFESLGENIVTQVNIGGRVYFLIVKTEETGYHVLVMKFCKNSIETMSEAFANEIAQKMEIELAPIRILWKHSEPWPGLFHMVGVSEQSTGQLALLEDMEKASCVLLQGFVRGEAFTFAQFTSTFCPLINDCIGQCGNVLGLIYVTDMFLRNCDRLIDMDLQWRGNLSNLMIYPGSDMRAKLIAIDTTICRRPPRLFARTDLVAIPKSLKRAMSDEAGCKLMELIGGEDTKSNMNLEQKQVFIKGFQNGIKSAYTKLSLLLPPLQQKSESLKKLFDKFFKSTEDIFGEVSSSTSKTTKKSQDKLNSRPGTARVREVGKVLKSHENEGDVSTTAIRDLAISLEGSLSSLPEPTAFTTHRVVGAQVSGPSLFSGAYEEMVRLEHMLVRGELILAETARLLNQSEVKTDEVTQSAVTKIDKVTQSPVAKTDEVPKFPPAIRNLPPIVLQHPLAAAAALAAITKKLKDMNTSPSQSIPESIIQSVSSTSETTS